ncbi:MAG: hypothetical protein K9W46_10745 [Candidatus Heimdallarchaeum endolithica]|uniref:ECF transporter S component n=1 Tax=Candidatus Heimdallarchaeum endolithica TaxID=2876572 RepID=A0A9Y1BPW8_9ARCH|nr:MAG: hypothetical protein K9W46_10745 [Candidatus Heimdallarchaeum endolithica]
MQSNNNINSTKSRFIVEKKDEVEIKNILKITTASSLSALGIVLSSITVLIPNVEFISFTIFLITILFGLSTGIFSMISISLIYELIVTPIYGSSGILILFKMVCYLILILITVILRKIIEHLSFWEIGVFGSFFALFYDIVTTIGGQLVIFQSNITLTYLFTVLVLGIPFTIIHILGNFIIFSSLKEIINWIKTAFNYKGIDYISLGFFEDKKATSSKKRTKKEE